MCRCWKILRATALKSSPPTPWPKLRGQRSQVRKDLAYFGEFGIRGVGYHITSLIAAITSSLGVDREWRMALVASATWAKPS